MQQGKPNVLSETTYDRGQCAVGVVHLGFGAFHRAHQSVYIDDYMQASGDLRWGIAAVNLRAADAPAFHRIASHNAPYVLKAMSPEGAVEYRTVRSHIRFEDWSSDAETAEGLLAMDSVHVLSVTVTESGYYLGNDGKLNAQDPVIAAELAGGPGTSVFAFLAAALERRKAAGGAPITILCCDNIRSNGDMLHGTLLRYLDLSGKTDLREWVQANATFPNSMVDRITPRSTPSLEDDMVVAFGAAGKNPVHCETFIQWVLQDAFAGPFPDLALAGVEVVDDVEPYEETKIRVLNGGHTCLTYLAALKGYQSFDEAMEDEELLAHFQGYETQEVLPGLPADLPFDKAAYLTSIAHRFANKAIADSVSRICADGYSKYQIFIRPTLKHTLEHGGMPHFGIAAIASWYVFARHVKAGKIGFPYQEPNWDKLEPLLREENHQQFCTTRALWDDLPDRFPEFARQLSNKIKEMEKVWPV